VICRFLRKLRIIRQSMIPYGMGLTHEDAIRIAQHKSESMVYYLRARHCDEPNFKKWHRTMYFLLKAKRNPQ
jgi:hypothetical protein